MSEFSRCLYFMWPYQRTDHHARRHRAWLVLALCAPLPLACASKSETSETRTTPLPHTNAAGTHQIPGSTPAAEDAEHAEHAEDAVPPNAALTSPIPARSRQLIVTLSADWNDANASFHRFERIASGPWQPVGEAFDSMLGRTGLAWGLGLHTTPPAADDPNKVEGDGKSPAGVFAVGALYGYDEHFAGSTRLDYQPVDQAWRCVNDGQSQHYNRVLDSDGVDKDWQEAEEMRRRDELYRLVIAIDHNAILGGTPVPQGGSCIFFHVWRRAGAPTIGCTAMPLTKMKMLASWLDPEQSPVLVALPRAQYRVLQEDWQLPEL